MVEHGSMFLGIDGGGTGCRALLCDAAGARLGMGRSGAANILRHVDDAGRHILDASCQALAEAGYDEAALSRVSAFLGLAGAHVGDGAARLEAALPFKACMIGTDAISSLEGALGSADGTVALIGTGSAFIYRVDGVVRTAGGWGPAVSDSASGAWLGRRLLGETLHCHDGIRLPSALTDQILAEFDHDPAAIVDYAEKARPSDFASRAPLIFQFFERRDPVARKIVAEAVADIEEILNAIMTADGGALCMLGSLGRVYAGLLSPALRRAIRPPLDDALGGAAKLAIRHFSARVEHPDGG